MLSELLLALALGPDPGAPAIVERVMAAVDGRPVLLSEVQALRALRGVSEADAVSALVDELLMEREAQRLTAAAPTEEEMARAVSGLDAPGIAPSTLRRLARREATILKYIGLRFAPQVRVSDEDVAAAWSGEGGTEAPPEEDAARIRERLVRADLDARVEAWVEELRAGAQVRR